MGNSAAARASFDTRARQERQDWSIWFDLAVASQRRRAHAGVRDGDAALNPLSPEIAALESAVKSGGCRMMRARPTRESRAADQARLLLRRLPDRRRRPRPRTSRARPSSARSGAATATTRRAASRSRGCSGSPAAASPTRCRRRLDTVAELPDEPGRVDIAERHGHAAHARRRDRDARRARAGSDRAPLRRRSDREADRAILGLRDERGRGRAPPRAPPAPRAARGA